MDVLALIQQALDASNKLKELSKKIENAEFKMFLADLHSALADAKLESVELKLKLATAQELALSLQRQLDQRDQGKPTLKEGCYSFEGSEGLFCTACWDSNEKKVLLASIPATFSFSGKYRCVVCNAKYTGY